MKSNKSKRKIIVYIGFLFVIVYVLYAIYLLLKQPTDKFTVEKGMLYEQETDIGYVIRDEQVLQGQNYKNGMEQIVNEGEKVAKGESVFRYYSKNEENIKKQIADLDTQIQEALKGQQDVLSSADAKSIENQLDEKIEKLSKETDISTINEYQKEINDLITKKSKIYGELSPAGSHLKQLYSQRTEFEKQINSGAEYISAPKSGIISYKVDGLESTLTPNNFSAFDKKFFENLNLKTGQLISTSEEAGKIIDSAKCYIATFSDSDEAKSAKVNDKVKIRLSNNKTLDATISYLSNEDNGDIQIILEIDREIAELANYRKISFDLIWWSSNGLKVPNQAIVEENGISYVVRNKAGYQNKIPVKIEKQNDKYSIVSNYTIDELKDKKLSEEEIKSLKSLSIYDEVILNPDLSKVQQ